jgi:hypothetical protein
LGAERLCDALTDRPGGTKERDFVHGRGPLAFGSKPNGIFRRQDASKQLTRAALLACAGVHFSGRSRLEELTGTRIWRANELIRFALCGGLDRHEDLGHDGDPESDDAGASTVIGKQYMIGAVNGGNYCGGYIAYDLPDDARSN